MKRHAIYKLFYAISLLSILIGIYQFMDSRLFDAVLSLAFSIIFLAAGIHYYKKKRQWHGK